MVITVKRRTELAAAGAIEEPTNRYPKRNLIEEKRLYLASTSDRLVEC